MFYPTNTLGALHISRRALLAHQAALTTIGHNLANAATPGYTRQRPVYETAAATNGTITTTPAPGSAFADQVSGLGTATTALGELDAVLDRATLSSTLVGARLGWLGVVEERLKDESLVLASTLSRVEDLDIAQAVQELTQVQMYYESGLAVSACLLQVSLLNFLK
jgi:flagellin-like hook-associated protein FlgL